MANNGIGICFTLCLLMYVVQGESNDVSNYDSSVTTECLREPWKPHYNGGILKNPGFDDGVSGWTLFGRGIIEDRVSSAGNRFVVARNRSRRLDSFVQKVLIDKGNFYSFSGWAQISEGSESVSAVFRTRDRKLVRGGSTIARKGCWSMIKGGITANYTGPIDLLFEAKNPRVEIWVDNVSLQPFTKLQWRSHQDQRIAKKRKSTVRLQVGGANKTQLQDATISISSTRTAFQFGCAMNHHILDSQHYRDWFAARFRVTAFTNEMKWYSTEKKQGHENYTVPDRMVEFAKQHNMAIRGHNILWDNPKMQPDWVLDLSPDDLKMAADKRIKSVVTRYAGDVIHWDCVNENLHFRFYEDNVGENASAAYFSMAHALDPKPIIFMNEYNTIEVSRDEKAGPVNYVKKIREIRDFPGNEGIPMGIGLQGHFGSSHEPNLAYMRASIDMLATTGLPIWLTEVSVSDGPNPTLQAEYLEEILREAYSNPAVEGIIMFSGPAPAGFNDTTQLADDNFENTAAGDVVDKLIDEWRSSNVVEAKTDSQGVFETTLFNGEYEVTVTHPSNSNTYVSSTIEVGKDKESTLERTTTFHIRVD